MPDLSTPLSLWHMLAVIGVGVATYWFKNRGGSSPSPPAVPPLVGPIPTGHPLIDALKMAFDAWVLDQANRMAQASLPAVNASATPPKA